MKKLKYILNYIAILFLVHPFKQKYEIEKLKEEYYSENE